jgi:hypothetical protein
MIGAIVVQRDCVSGQLLPVKDDAVGTSGADG